MGTKMNTIKIAIPKGESFSKIIDLFDIAGIIQRVDHFDGILYFKDSQIRGNIVNNASIPMMVKDGLFDVGFSDYDLISNQSSDVIELTDTQLNPKTIFVARNDRPLYYDNNPKIVKTISQYNNIAHRYLTSNNYTFELIKSYGSSDIFSVNDVDMIIDSPPLNSSFEAHGFKVIDSIMQSSLRIISNHSVLNNIRKNNIIDSFVNNIFSAVKKYIPNTKNTIDEKDFGKSTLNEDIKLQLL